MKLITPRSQGAVQAMAPPLFTPAPEREAETTRPHWRGGLEFGAASRWGQHHPENEDSYLLLQGAGLPIGVADGVGGGALGKVASRVMTERMRMLTPALLDNAAQLRAWLLASDDKIAAEIARDADRVGASTFVAAVPAAGGQRWVFTWAGDCRAYLLTAANELQCLTLDDTYKNLRETPPSGAGPDDPARMVGNGAVDRANLGEVRLLEGDLLFLCSDGVHRFVPAEQVVSLLRAGGSLAQCCRRLTAAAHANGGNDDATVVAVQRHPWFGVRHAPRWVALITLAFVLALLAWQYLAHGKAASGGPLPPQPSSATSNIPVPALPAANPPAPVPAAEGLRLVPDRALRSGPQPVDVAVPVKKPPTGKSKAAKLAESHTQAPVRHDKEAPRRPRIPLQSTPGPAQGNEAATRAPKLEAPGSEPKPEAAPGNGE